MSEKTREITKIVIKNPCKWCDGTGVTEGFWPPVEACSHCIGTGDHYYRRDRYVTYEEILVGKVE